MECPICFEVITDKNKIKKTTCGHKFCKECINEWIEWNDTCPLCREVLPERVVINVNENFNRNTSSIKLVCSGFIIILSILFIVFILAVIMSIMSYKK